MLLISNARPTGVQLYFTVLDLNKWDAALYTEKLVRKWTLEQMWTPVTCSDGKKYHYGFGWWVQESSGHRLLEHGGAWQGFSAYISRYVHDRLTVAVLTNLDADHSDARRIAHEVARLYLLDLRMKPITDTEPQVSAVLRTTLTELAAGKVNLASFAPAKSLSLLESQNEEDLRHYKYRVEFADGPILVELYLNRDKKLLPCKFVLTEPYIMSRDFVTPGERRSRQCEVLLCFSDFRHIGS